MREMIAGEDLIACCGLYCAACGKYLKEKCPGCKANEDAAWCKVRSCCIENERLSCADCGEFESVLDCRKFNNPMARLRSDRAGCIALIKEERYEGYARHMAENGMQSVKG